MFKNTFQIYGIRWKKTLHSLEQGFSTIFDSRHPSLVRKQSVGTPTSNSIINKCSKIGSGTCRAFSEHLRVPRHPC